MGKIIIAFITILWKTFRLAFISIIYRSVFIKKLLSILDMSVFPETEWEIGIEKIFKNIFLFFRYFPNFFSKYEKSFGSYFQYAFRKSTKIPEIYYKKKISKPRFLDISDIHLSARHYGILYSGMNYL